MIPLLCLVGPTASGKSALALEICERIGGEIVTCDSMQPYRGCDIVTAKPTLAEQQRVPHHLIDICDPDQRFSAADWTQAAHLAIADIHCRGKIAVVCGGTGFYLRALLFPDFLSDVPPDSVLKARLEAQLSEQGSEFMWAELQKIDAEAAQRLHPNDSFRVVRALEIALLRPASSAVQTTKNEPFEAHIFALENRRERLYARIEARVEAMIEAGALQEIEMLRKKWGDDAPALGGVGYKQMLPVLRGEVSLESGVEFWKRDSRRYAKRQMTWFRHQLPVQWLDATRASGHLAELEQCLSQK